MSGVKEVDEWESEEIRVDSPNPRHPRPLCHRASGEKMFLG